MQNRFRENRNVIKYVKKRIFKMNDNLFCYL